MPMLPTFTSARVVVDQGVDPVVVTVDPCVDAREFIPGTTNAPAHQPNKVPAFAILEITKPVGGSLN